jgi:hypothetical protein
MSLTCHPVGWKAPPHAGHDSQMTALAYASDEANVENFPIFHHWTRLSKIPQGLLRVQSAGRLIKGQACQTKEKGDAT